MAARIPPLDELEDEEPDPGPPRKLGIGFIFSRLHSSKIFCLYSAVKLRLLGAPGKRLDSLDEPDDDGFDSLPIRLLGAPGKQLDPLDEPDDDEFDSFPVRLLGAPGKRSDPFDVPDDDEFDSFPNFRWSLRPWIRLSP